MVERLPQETANKSDGLEPSRESQPAESQPRVDAATAVHLGHAVLLLIFTWAGGGSFWMHLLLLQHFLTRLHLAADATAKAFAFIGASGARAAKHPRDDADGEEDEQGAEQAIEGDVDEVGVLVQDPRVCHEGEDDAPQDATALRPRVAGQQWVTVKGAL